MSFLLKRRFARRNQYPGIQTVHFWLACVTQKQQSRDQSLSQIKGYNSKVTRYRRSMKQSGPPFLGFKLPAVQFYRSLKNRENATCIAGWSSALSHNRYRFPEITKTWLVCVNHIKIGILADVRAHVKLDAWNGPNFFMPSPSLVFANLCCHNAIFFPHKILHKF